MCVKQEFSSIKKYVEYFGLQDEIARREAAYKEDDNYGIVFEDAIVKQLKVAGFNVRKTGAAHDFIKGADLKMLFGESSISIDVKLNMQKAMKRNIFYVGDGLEFSRNKEDIFFYPISKYIEVGFTLKNIRRGDEGYCTLKKPVLVAIFRFNIDIKKNQHRLFTINAAKEFAKYVYYINMELHRSEGYPLRDCNSFLFTPYTEGYKNKIKHWRYENDTKQYARNSMRNRINNNRTTRSRNNNTCGYSKK